jgi:hypothetical protein
MTRSEPIFARSVINWSVMLSAKNSSDGSPDKLLERQHSDGMYRRNGRFRVDVPPRCPGNHPEKRTRKERKEQGPDSLLLAGAQCRLLVEGHGRRFRGQPGVSISSIGPMYRYPRRGSVSM